MCGGGGGGGAHGAPQLFVANTYLCAIEKAIMVGSPVVKTNYVAMLYVSKTILERELPGSGPRCRRQVKLYFSSLAEPGRRRATHMDRHSIQFCVAHGNNSLIN